MKKTLLILFFNFIALIIKNVKMTSVCESIISKNFQESTIIEEIRNKIDSLVKEEKCVEQLLRNGFYLGTEVLIEEMSKRKIRFKDNLKSSINSISKDMDNLYNKFNFDHTDYQVVSPAFMWAQSLDNIYLLIKFGHRHDAPGCLEIKNKEIYINKNILTFKAYCIQGDVPMKLDLKLDMYDEVIQEESIWAKSSVGRFQITLKKKKSPSFWKNLYRDGSIVPSNMKVWFDMKSKFETELKTYYEAEEDDLDKESEEKKDL